ncbi:MAG TPA: hypothetical protein VN231_10780 [Allosphingosinicella sp.]|nr:hypothetical protein [Allosphingosinicella sp.]
MIRYLNTDLELLSPADLGPLVAAFEERGLITLHCGQREDGSWEAYLETEAQYDAPEPNIAAILAAVEALPGPVAALWAGCTNRGFSIGYEGGNAPRALQQKLSSRLLGRVAALGGCIGIAIYAPDGIVAPGEPSG